jgi:hypothetical protein
MKRTFQVISVLVIGANVKILPCVGKLYGNQPGFIEKEDRDGMFWIYLPYEQCSLPFDIHEFEFV